MHPRDKDFRMLAHSPASPAGPALFRAFMAAAGMATLGTAAGFTLARGGHGIPELAGAMVIVFAACCAMGLHVQRASECARRGEVARVYAAALSGRRNHAIETQREPRSALEALGSLFGLAAENARASVAKRERLAQYAADMQQAVETSRSKSYNFSRGLTEDARAIAVAAEGSRQAECALAGRLQTVCEKAESAEAAGTAIAVEATMLAASVRAVTEQTERATDIASRLAETAFASQKSVTAMTELANPLLAAVEQVQSVLARTEIVAMGSHETAVAAEVKQLAATGRAALEALLTAVRGLREEGGAVFQRVQELSDLVQAQHEFGHALSHTALLQADAVGRVLQQMDTATSDLRELSAEARNVKLPERRLGTTSAVQHAVERLPSYAEAMAQIVRGLPVYSAVDSEQERTPSQ